MSATGCKQMPIDWLDPASFNGPLEAVRIPMINREWMGEQADDCRLAAQTLPTR
jgi:hypothetical protein